MVHARRSSGGRDSVILGLSMLGRDSAACLLVDGRVTAAAQEERFSLRKHDPAFPVQAARYCLGTLPRSRRVVAAAAVFERDRNRLRGLCERSLGIPPFRTEFVDPALAQISAGFFASGFDRAAVLLIDDLRTGPSCAIAQAVSGVSPSVSLTASRPWPHTPAFLSSVFTGFLGFPVPGGDYQLMGLSGYGRPSYKDKIRKLFRRSSDGLIDLDLSYFVPGATPSWSGKFTTLFGLPRTGDQFRVVRSDGRLELRDRRDIRYADLAASVQAILDEIVLGMARRSAGRGNLCVAGETGLNCVANAAVLRRSGYSSVFVQPAAGPAGAAMGAALHHYRVVLKGTTRFKLTDPFLGKSWSNEEILSAVRGSGLEASKSSTGGIADALASGRVIGWFRDGFEWGPRALGHRSILADPRDPGMRHRVNVRIKRRDLFRPFAPSVTAEKAGLFFEDAGILKSRLTRFMLAVLRVRKSKRALIPAVTHADGTARVHVVDRRTDPEFHALLNAFAKRSGVPVLLNTSFNLKSYPMVSSPGEALRMFKKSGLDLLVMGRIAVRRRER